MLYVVLCPWEEETRPAELFEFQHCQTVRLRYFNNTLIKNRLRSDLRHAVEEVSDDPIEHLDEEREFLQYPAV